MKHNPRYALKHLSIRVPWHDNAWNGTICSSPKSNGSCLVLKNCAENKDDEHEEGLAGIHLSDLEESKYPPCIGERATFMSAKGITKTLKHPYVHSSPETHGHLKPTVVGFPAYSAAAVPYNWMLKSNTEGHSSLFDLDYDSDREPELKFENDNWVQEATNQSALLNCFFQHLKEETSLVFFYAKQVPFVEDSGRVLVGVGRIKQIVPSEKYDGSNKRFSARYWEHMVLHSIRPGGNDGFLLPYHDAIKHQEEYPEFDVADLAVKTPADKQFEYSYAAEHVSNDTSIRTLLECIKCFELAKELGIGSNHELHIKWIHDEIAKLEQLRGDYPGMGSALCAFGLERGHFVAASIINQLEEGQNPWKVFEEAIATDGAGMDAQIFELIPRASKKLYERLAKKSSSNRLDFLHLLSRFDISIEQATLLWVKEERSKKLTERAEKDYLDNPYLIYEDLRLSTEPIDLLTLDIGLFIKKPGDHLLPDNLILNDPLDSFRIRALTIQQLERASLIGHTLLPRKQLVNQIRELPIEPACPVNSDYYEMAEEEFGDVVECVSMGDDSEAYQLRRFAECKTIITQKVNDRISSQRLAIEADWRELLNDKLDPHTQGDVDEQEENARSEKAAALTEIAESRFSVLIGPAGTGKTTLLTILASQYEVERKGVLLLAPTGKARVRMQEVAKDIDVEAKTLAQFLNQYDRFEGETQRYVFSDNRCEGKFETVILDEASMLTEEMLATTLDCLKGVKRFILVGDNRQLPPIGAGRPFFDIIHHLQPDGVGSMFPKVATGYAELTIKRRQGGAGRNDIQLAEWFSGGPLDAGADDIFNKIVAKPDGDYLRVEKWEKEGDFEELFEKVLVEELAMDDPEDVKTFNITLGSEDGRYFNFRTAADKAEDWQILSPVREKVFGVRALNRGIHKKYRKEKVEYARSKYSKIPLPVGLEEIVYGDKVINLANSSRFESSVWPQEDALNYIANGEIGMVIGQMKTKNHSFVGRPKNTEIEFSSQKGFKYTFRSKEFNEEADVPLELAYALTVHKSQGSEFGKVFLVIPNPCFLLSREMLYTALTRQRDKVILLYQGSKFDIKELASPKHSDTLSRITNLFKAPILVEVDGKYLEKNLIHQASDGKMLRSKSELTIYQRLIDKKVNVIYERPLTIKDVEKLPDFTVDQDDTGRTFYWEHCGMLHDKEYKKRWEEKYQWYRDNDILPLEEGGGENGTLIISQDEIRTVSDGSTRGAISIPKIDELIHKAFGV